MVVYRMPDPRPRLHSKIAAPRERLEGVSEIEAIAKNHLGDQMIGRVGHAHTEAEIHFPLRRKIQVDRGKQLMLLLTGGKEVGGRTEGAVVLESAGNLLCEIVAEFEVRREGEALMDTLPVKGAIKSRIEGEVPGAGLFVDDRANLPGPGVGGESAALVANFVRKAQAHRPLPLFGDMHTGPNMVANPVPALAILHAGKNVEPRL